MSMEHHPVMLNTPEQLRECLDSLGMSDVPIFSFRRTPEASDFAEHASWVLRMQGFQVTDSDGEKVLVREGRELMRATNVHDLMLLLVTTGAWAGVK